MILEPKTIAFALIGGIIPAIVWLWFWLKEDHEHPEPKRVIIRSFIMGGIVVFFVFFLDKVFINHVLQNPQINNELKNLYVVFSLSKDTLIAVSTYAPALLGLAFTEELMKYLAAKFSALNSKTFDEPIDAMIYMITAAIGFAAVENTLFLFNIISANGGTADFLLTGNLRFLGSTILHIVSSATVGYFIGLSFYSSKTKKLFYILAGLIVATVLHALFNFFIIVNEGSNIFKVLLTLWFAAILIIVFFEKVKLKNKNQYV